MPVLIITYSCFSDVHLGSELLLFEHWFGWHVVLCNLVALCVTLDSAYQEVCGMSKKDFDINLERIFDNGFTTKNNENNGIGLYLLKEIVEKGDGTIEITSEENKGTTFIITFEL